MNSVLASNKERLLRTATSDVETRPNTAGVGDLPYDKMVARYANQQGGQANISALNSQDSPVHEADIASISESLSRRLYFAPLRRFFGSGPNNSRFEVLRQYEGEVIDIAENQITALLTNYREDDMPVERVVFQLSEVPEADLDLVEIGSEFYWTLGFEKTPGGTERRVSEVRFRREPRWTANQLEAIRAESESLWDIRGGENSR